MPTLTPDSFEYIELGFDAMSVRVLKSSLEDQRGVGTMARSLLQGFKKEEFVTNGNWSPIHLFPYFGDFQTPPLRRSILIVHDLITLKAPEYAAQSVNYKARLKTACEAAMHIVTPSETTKDDLGRFLGIQRDKITVIHNPIAPVSQAICPAVKIPNAPYFSFVGTNNNYKNAEVVIRAMALLKDLDIHLVLCGRGHYHEKLIDELGLEGKIHCLSHLSHTSTAYVVAKSKALLYPSSFEGFGLCPFEAAMIDTPSIVYKASAQAEVIQPNEVVWCDTLDPQEWAVAMRAVANGSSLTHMVAKYKQRIQTDLNPKVIAKQYIELFKKFNP